MNSFQQFFNWVPIAGLTMDKQGVILHANPTTLQYLGNLELRGKSLTHYLAVQDHKKFTQFINNLNKPNTEHKLRLQLSNQNHFTLLQAQSFSTPGKQLEINLTLTPINSDNSKSKKNQLLNKDLVGIIIFDTECKIKYANNSITDLFGYPTDELLQQPITKLVSSPNSKIHPDFIHYFKHKADRILGVNLELTGRHKDNTVVLFNSTVNKYDIDHEHSYIAMFQLINEHKYKSKPDKERLDALADVTRVGLMAEMASGISHEVNQPLTAISAYTQTCLSLLENPNFSKEKLTEILLKTKKQVLKAGQIIHRMRDFSKTRKMSCSLTDINQLVLDALEFCEPDCKQFKVQQKTELATNLPLTFVDPIHIEQVILNLIRNSIEALQNMSELPSKTLTIETYLNDKEQIEVRVKDNGSGLNPNEQLKVLNPFYTTKKNGMGMGLSISRSIIEAHDGVLRFNSQESKGTTCYFTLPVYEEMNELR